MKVKCVRIVARWWREWLGRVPHTGNKFRPLEVHRHVSTKKNRTNLRHNFRIRSGSQSRGILHRRCQQIHTAAVSKAIGTANTTNNINIAATHKNDRSMIIPMHSERDSVVQRASLAAACRYQQRDSAITAADFAAVADPVAAAVVAAAAAGDAERQACVDAAAIAESAAATAGSRPAVPSACPCCHRCLTVAGRVTAALAAACWAAQPATRPAATQRRPHPPAPSVQ